MFEEGKGNYMTHERFFREIKGKRVGFCGIARTNLPLIELFLKKGAIVSARDKKEEFGEIGDKLKKLGVTLILGERYLDDIHEDILFRAPGMPFLLPPLTEARKKGCVVTSEMELFFDLCPCKIYAVTGSDGKTTTTSIIAECLKAEGKRVHLGGNIGHPLLPLIEEISAHDAAVVELSSFQLISMRKSPHVAVLTNLAPNHLDVHKDMEEYVSAKKNIFLHQDAFSRTVMNLDNALTAPMTEEVRGDCWGFSRKVPVERGACVQEGRVLVCGRPLMAVSDIKIPGNHNVENYLAAICAVWGEVSPENIVAVAKTFGGVAHRAELVRKFEGVTYFNDSIASSPSRAMSGTLSLYRQKIIMIAGGADKNVPFTELGAVICEKVKVLILVKPAEQLPGFKPSAADKISKAVTDARAYFDGHPVIIRVSTMEEAVDAAREAAAEGDIVSLCPACTGFDMYPDFEVRGNHYKEIVMKLV